MADGLSKKGEMPLIYMLTLPSPSWWSVVEELHETHEEIKTLKQRVEKGELGGQWTIQRGMLFFINRVYLPKYSDFVPVILQQYHECGHEGFYKTPLQIKECFHWTDMKTRVKEWVRQCDVCQRNKYDQQLPPGLLQPLPIPTQVWAAISMDFVERLPKVKGKSIILVVVDRLSKYDHFFTHGTSLYSGNGSSDFL